jgi:hypothetical protein
MKRAAHVHWGLVLGHASPLLCVRSYRNVRGCGLRAGKAKLGIKVCVRTPAKLLRLTGLTAGYARSMPRE